MGKKAFLQTFDGSSATRIPRGEVWMGSRIFSDLGLADTLPSRVSLCEQLDMDYLFLPVVCGGNPSPEYDYRSFSIEDIEQSLPIGDLAVGLNLDGPFQRLARKEGMPAVFSLFLNPPEIMDKLEAEVEVLSSEILRLGCLNCDAVLLADDMAYQRGTYIGLTHFEIFLAPLYRRLVALIHQHQLLALFHSDGNWTLFAEELAQCGFDGFAAVQSECMDLPSLQKKTGKTLMAGMEFSHLASPGLEPAERNAWLQWIHQLTSGGRFILSSSCGISSKQDIENLMRLYAWVDQ